MTLTAAPVRNTYIAGVLQTTFPYTFPILDASELLVYQDTTLLTLSVHYNVTGVGNSGGGNVVFGVGAPAGSIVVIIGHVPIDQQTDYLEHNPFPSQAHEGALDRLTRIAQQFQEAIDRAPKFIPPSLYQAITMPEPGTLPTVLNTRKAIVWNTSETNLELANLPAAFPSTTPPAALPTGTYNILNFGALGNDAFDNATAFATAVASVGEGSELVFPPGRYRYTGTFTLNKQIGIRGHTGKSVLVPMTNNAPGIIASSSFVRITDLFMERIVKPIIGGDGIVMQEFCSNAILSRLHVEKCYRGIVLGGVDIGYLNTITVHGCESHGIEFSYGTFGVQQWHLLHVLSQSNLGDGYRAANTTAGNGIGPFLNDCISFNNGGGGFFFSGTLTTPLNDIMMVRCLSSFDAFYGIAFDNTWGQAHMLHLPWVEFAGDGGAPRGFDGITQPPTNAAHGIRIVGSNNPGMNIIGGLVWQCTWSGMQITTPGILVNGLTFFDNGKALHASIVNRAGLLVSADSVAIDSCLFVQNTGVTQQIRGIVLTGAQVDTKIGPANKFVGYAGPLLYVDTTLATLVGTVPALATLGLSVSTGRVPFSIHDETGGATPTKFMRVAGGRYQVLDNALAVPIVNIGDAGDMLLSNYLEMTEITDPANPAGNKARLYTRDNGLGKTQIVARFPTGGVVVIATEL